MPIYVSRLSTWLEKRFNAKGGQVVNDIDVVGKLVLPWQVGVEDRYLQGWNRFGVGANTGGQAALFAAMRIRNPSGSQVIAVLERVIAFSSTAAVVDQPVMTIQVTLSDFGTLVSTTFIGFDTRGLQTPTCVVSRGNASPVTGTVTYAGQFNGTVPFDFISSVDTQVVLLPGSSVTIWSQVANQALFISYVWRERALELSELT